MMTGLYKLENSSIPMQQSNNKVYYNSNTNTYLLLSREENMGLEAGIWMVGYSFLFEYAIHTFALSFYVLLHLFWIFLLQITEDPRYNSYDIKNAKLRAEIVAVNLKCINYEDPTHDKCEDGQFSRTDNTTEFTKYPTLRLRCRGN